VLQVAERGVLRVRGVEGSGGIKWLRMAILKSLDRYCQSGVNTLSHVTSPRPASAWAPFPCI
jgi:hypothetical protein